MLNPQQRAAVEYVDGPLLVLAGAGSGKTRVITEKIAYLIERGLVPVGKIAAITFTNKAAREMRERVAKRIRGDAAEGLNVCTFHALGLKFLQIEHARAGLRRGFSVLDADDSAGLVKELAGAAVKSDKLFQLRSLLSRLNSDGLTPDGALRAARTGSRATLRRVPEAAGRIQRGGCRRPDPVAGCGAGARRGYAHGLARASSLPAGGRMPGHQRRAVRVPEIAGRRARRFHLR